jgi:hypothetical protein
MTPMTNLSPTDERATLTDERLKELLADLESVRRAVFGDLGGCPDVYADYDQLIAMECKMSHSIAYLSTLDPTLLSLRQKDGEMVEALSGLASMAADKRLELGFHQKVYGDDDDEPTHGKWVIWREIGNINDREWEVVATGTTPSDALAALSQRSAE